MHSVGIGRKGIKKGGIVYENPNPRPLRPCPTQARVVNGRRGAQVFLFKRKIKGIFFWLGME